MSRKRRSRDRQNVRRISREADEGCEDEDRRSHGGVGKFRRRMGRQGNVKTNSSIKSCHPNCSGAARRRGALVGGTLVA